jgi:hypothetical protein
MPIFESTTMKSIKESMLLLEEIKTLFERWRCTLKHGVRNSKYEGIKKKEFEIKLRIKTMKCRGMGIRSGKGMSIHISRASDEMKSKQVQDFGRVSGGKTSPWQDIKRWTCPPISLRMLFPGASRIGGRGVIPS